MPKPIVTPESDLGALGVRIVDSTVSDDLQWIFRTRDQRDLGIDGEIEVVTESNDGSKRFGSGRLIAVQIKCGESFFKEEFKDSYVYRGEPKHYDYWSDFSIPVIIVICHPRSRKAFWVEFNQSAANVTKLGWSIKIPKNNHLGGSKFSLESISKRFHLDNLIDLSVQSWMHVSNTERVEFCGILNMPRDFHWFDHLVQIGDKQIALSIFYSRYGKFDTDDIQEHLMAWHVHERYAEELYICLVTENAKIFFYDEKMTNTIIEYPGISFFYLVFDRSYGTIGQLNKNKEIVIEWYKGKSEWKTDLTGELL